jgi:hypothetical protein
MKLCIDKVFLFDNVYVVKRQDRVHGEDASCTMAGPRRRTLQDCLSYQKVPPRHKVCDGDSP